MEIHRGRVAYRARKCTTEIYISGTILNNDVARGERKMSRTTADDDTFYVVSVGSHHLLSIDCGFPTSFPNLFRFQATFWAAEMGRCEYLMEKGLYPLDRHLLAYFTVARFISRQGCRISTV
jgi:hypothetical protein